MRLARASACPAKEFKGIVPVSCADDKVVINDGTFPSDLVAVGTGHDL